MTVEFNWTDIDLDKRDEQADPLAWQQADTNWQKIMDKLNESIAPAIASIIELLPQSGDMRIFAGSSSRTGWLVCNGAAYSRVEYASLFAIIGTTYGAGNGTSTFNIPDLRGRTAIGVGQGSGLTNRTLGSSIGAETNTHTHTINVENGAPNDVTVSGDTGNALGGYTPAGNLNINGITPAGALQMNSYTPEGGIDVVVDNHITNIQESAPHTHDVVLSAVPVTADGAVNAVPSNTYTTTGHIVTIPIDLPHNVSTKTFTGTAKAPTGNFVGAPTNITGSFNGTLVNLQHNHSFSDTITSDELTHDHNAEAENATIPVMQPSLVLNYFIKI